MKTIMVVDDEPDNRTTVQTLLEKEGYTVCTAVDGDDCLKQLKKTKADLVLMDVMMPGTPVSEVVPQLKTKVAYMTVIRTSEIERERLLDAKNVVGYIQKPFSIKQLLAEVKRFVQ